MGDFLLGHKWRDVFAWCDQVESRCGVRRCDFKPHGLDRRMAQIVHDVARESNEVAVNALLGEFCRLFAQRVDAAIQERKARTESPCP